MVHADLKMKNILVTEHGEGVIGDIDDIIFIHEEVGQEYIGKVHTTRGDHIYPAVPCLGAPWSDTSGNIMVMILISFQLLVKTGKRLAICKKYDNMDNGMYTTI